MLLMLPCERKCVQSRDFLKETKNIVIQHKPLIGFHHDQLCSARNPGLESPGHHHGTRLSP